MRDALGDVLYKIRFPVMELQDFLTVVNQKGILTEAEAMGVVMTIRGLSHSKPMPFSTNRRAETWKEFPCVLHKRQSLPR